MKIWLLFIFAWLGQTFILNAADPIHVLVWDERQPRQKQAYDNYLGNEIVARLKATTTELEFRSVALDDVEQGLSSGNLEWADVIIWWGHVRQGEITEATSQHILDYIKRGDLDLIALHSAHYRSAHPAKSRHESARRFCGYA